MGKLAAHLTLRIHTHINKCVCVKIVEEALKWLLVKMGFFIKEWTNERRT